MWLKICTSSAAFLGASGLMALATPYLLVPEANLESSAVVTEMARSQVTIGDQLAASGQFSAAAEEYAVAVRLVRAQGRLPLEELRRVANARYYASDFASAAGTLAALADEAASRGDHLAHFWAALDASRMGRLGGDEVLAELYEARIQALLGSDDLPASTRAELAAKLDRADDLTVFAPHLTSW